ncbi:MAG: glutamate--tRNA ligase, partial [Mesorhizobium sp.]
SENVAAAHDLAELAGHFDPAATSKSSSKFDPAELFVLNRVLLHRMPFAEARDRLMVLGISGEHAEPFWLAVRGNLDRLADAAAWWRVLREGPQEMPEFSDDDRDFLHQALDLLPEEPWNGTVWKDWTGKIREATGRKGKALFMPLRLALTGRSSGPELADLLPLMGREGTLARRP